MDPFTCEFKRLKARNPPPNYDDLIDFDSLTENEWTRKVKLKGTNLKPVLGLKPCSEWNVFHFMDHEGFYVIQNPFVDGYQSYWVKRCLEDFPADESHVTNLTALGEHDSRTLWKDFAGNNGASLGKQDPLRKLRWTNLGYHYDWTARVYIEDRKADFPLDVQCLCQYISVSLGLGLYQGEAAIVNYYHLDSTLTGHTDHSELDYSAPIFTFSFGQNAVFMLGGPTKAETPISMFLKSGDICILSGSARLAYHAVPKILEPPADLPVPACLSFAASPNSVNSHSEETLEVGTDVQHTNPCPEKCLDEEIQYVPDSALCQCVLPQSKGRFGSSCESNKMSQHETEATVSEDSDVIGNSGKTNPCNGKTPDVVSSTQEPKSSNRSNCANLSKQFFQHYSDLLKSANRGIVSTMNSLDWTPFKAYLGSTRLNMNVRQVQPLVCSNLCGEKQLKAPS